MREKFYIFENKDAGNVYRDALISAGYRRVYTLGDADFILYDSEGVGGRFNVKREFLKRKRGFIYPHTPFTCYIWDGPYTPLPVSCNFVAGQGQKDCMAAYGYPYRVEACGFTRCQVVDFQPTQGRNLLFVPARPRRDHGRQEALDRYALNFILENRDDFDRITICRVAGQFSELEENYKGIRIITTDPKGATAPAGDMLERIESHDIIISVTTPAALGVARGKPVIMYGQEETPETLAGNPARSFEAYRRDYKYPLSLESMSIDEVLRFAQIGSPAVEDWKRRHIGGNFDRSKFIKTVSAGL